MRDRRSAMTANSTHHSRRRGGALVGVGCTCRLIAPPAASAARDPSSLEGGTDAVRPPRAHYRRNDGLRLRVYPALPRSLRAGFAVAPSAGLGGSGPGDGRSSGLGTAAAGTGASAGRRAAAHRAGAQGRSGGRSGSRVRRRQRRSRRGGAGMARPRGVGGTERAVQSGWAGGRAGAERRRGRCRCRRRQPGWRRRPLRAAWTRILGSGKDNCDVTQPIAETYHREEGRHDAMT